MAWVSPLHYQLYSNNNIYSSVCNIQMLCRSLRRVAVRQDTCSIVAISLNIMQKVHPVIWSLSNLPFDCTQVMAVPKPIGELPQFVCLSVSNLVHKVYKAEPFFSGGVVVFAVNSLLYLNQSVPPYGVSLNSQTNGTTAFPLRKHTVRTEHAKTVYRQSANHSKLSEQTLGHSGEEETSSKTRFRVDGLSPLRCVT